jgi:hypothetical protein
VLLIGTHFSNLYTAVDMSNDVIGFDGQIYSFVAREINAGTLNMEPYLTAEDFNRLGVEIVFMVMAFYYILTFIFDLLAHAARGNLLLWSEKYGMAYIVMDCANFGTDACLQVVNMRIMSSEVESLATPHAVFRLNY